MKLIVIGQVVMSLLVKMYNYKLTYFNMRGRAELARYIFAYAAIPFEKLPIMEVDGIIIPQSLAIARYLAKETGLAGATSLEEAQTDALVDCMNDFTIMIPWNEKNKEVKEKQIEELFLIHSPVLMKNLTKALGEKTWLVGESVSRFLPILIHKVLFENKQAVLTAALIQSSQPKHWFYGRCMFFFRHASLFSKYVYM
ncbi:hematopoietic prostaglandin D synthase-like isoform X4 [Polypterus senegalus]|uniref:hematopoietic prostaglandin D synthase-like isoform X4 n=1 Tax=Polypterus senegalus TaxID=55291 RepID=UPI00196339DC|nr:hematopoietic prostaglandin D synthase-like isoform X4 [Polypterus senegalus]